MLTLTPNAETVIRDLLDASPLPDGAGVRIASDPDNGDGHGLRLSLVERPEPADRIVEDVSVPVFVEAEAAPLLDESVLDATARDDGVSFSVESRSA
ncbi:MAG: Fe-S cluster assembly protein HesB [Thermoleophilia bacterium]